MNIKIIIILIITQCSLLLLIGGYQKVKNSKNELNTHAYTDASYNREFNNPARSQKANSLVKKQNLDFFDSEESFNPDNMVASSYHNGNSYHSNKGVNHIGYSANTNNKSSQLFSSDSIKNSIDLQTAQNILLRPSNKNNAKGEPGSPSNGMNKQAIAKVNQSSAITLGESGVILVDPGDDPELEKRIIPLGNGMWFILFATLLYTAFRRKRI